MRFNRLPPLKSLKGFEATARLHSVSKAAQELCLTPPAISHQLQALETSLGIELFTRQGRKLVLTDAGRLLYPYALNALQEVERGVAALAALKDQPPPLIIQTYVTAATRWLGPRIRQLQQSLGFPVQLNSSGVWEFDDQRFDVGLVYLEQPPGDDYCWFPLFPYRLSAVCAPQLRAQAEHALQQGDISQLPFIQVHTEKQHWELWLAQIGIHNYQPQQALSVDTLAISLELSRNGEGISIINGPFAERELAEGSLVPLLSHSIDLGQWGVIYRQDSCKHAQIESFCQWLQTQCP